MRKFGVGEMNENGHLFVDFCQENGLVIGGTLFRHKAVYKYMWESPDGRPCNQIDHIVVNRKWAASVKDVRTRRGADVGSDHVLLVAKVDVGRLKNEEMAQEFRLKMFNRYEVLRRWRMWTSIGWSCGML